MAIETMKMSAEDYRQLTEEHTQDWVVDELQRKILDEGLAAYNLRSLRESLQRDSSIAKKALLKWQPPKVWNKLFFIHFNLFYFISPSFFFSPSLISLLKLNTVGTYNARGILNFQKFKVALKPLPGNFLTLQKVLS